MNNENKAEREKEERDREKEGRDREIDMLFHRRGRRRLALMFPWILISIMVAYLLLDYVGFDPFFVKL